MYHVTTNFTIILIYSIMNLRLQYPVNFKQSKTFISSLIVISSLQYPVNFKQSKTTLNKFIFICLLQYPVNFKQSKTGF